MASNKNKFLVHASTSLICRWSWTRVRAHPCSPIRPYIFLTYIPSASGFTTRSDMGSTREGPSAEVIVRGPSLGSSQTLNPVFTARRKPGMVKSRISILNNFRAPTSSTASFPALHTKLMTRKLTKSTSNSTEPWIYAGAPVARRARRQNWRSIQGSIAQSAQTCNNNSQIYTRDCGRDGLRVGEYP